MKALAVNFYVFPVESQFNQVSISSQVFRMEVDVFGGHIEQFISQR